MPRTFINYGHRGDSHRWPENTLVALRSAIEAGANAVEIDLRRTRDGELVAFHDDDLSRTTNAAQVFPGREKQGIEQFTLAELRQLDAGSWKTAEAKGEKIPTLAEVFADVKDQATLVLDVKDGRTAADASKILKSSGFDPKQIIVFTEGDALDDYHTALPDAQLLAISSEVPTGRHDDFFQTLRDRGVHGFSLNWNALVGHRDFIAAAHRHEMIVIVWTVNDRTQMQAALDAGVDGIGTDHPGVLADVVRTLRVRSSPPKSN